MRLLFVFLLGCASAAPDSGFPEVGATFPTFEVKDHDGATVANASLKGRYAVFEFVRSGDW